MNFLLENKKYLFFLGGLILLAVVFIIYSISLLFSPQSKNPSISPTPTPFKSLQTPIPTDRFYNYDPYSKQYKENAKQNIGKEKDLLEQDLLVAKFIETLPYYGKSVQVFYSISTNKITVILSRTNIEEASKEFDGLLQKNNIINRDWIDNLVVKVDYLPQ